MINSGSITTIRVKFTEDVEQTSAEASGNYTVTQVGGGSLTITGVTLDSTDNSIVEITHTEDQTQDVSYQVVINNVEDLNGNKVATDTSGYFLGNGPLSVASAAASGPARVIVTFSEPIATADDSETLDGTNYTVSGLAVSGAAWPSGGAGDRTVVELTTSQQLQQIYTLVLAADVLHAADDNTTIAAGYNAVSFQGDGIPAVSSVMSFGPTHVKVVFSETVDLTTAQNTANYAITSAGYPSLSITGATRTADPYTNEVTLTTSSQLYVNYTVTATDVQDTTGNAISGNNTADFAGIGTDNTPPAVISISASGSDIKVYFNEAVEETSAETLVNYTLNGLSTATLTVDHTITNYPQLDETLEISVTSSDTGLDLITITAKDAENLGNYEFNRGEIAALSDEVIAYSIASAINADTQSPVKAYVNGSQVELVSRTFGDNGDITITDNLNGVAVTGGPTDITGENPTVAARSTGNSAQVDLTFGASSGIYEIEIANVTDTTQPPNAITTTTATVLIRGSDTDPPQLAGAFAIDETHIKLLFDEPVDFVTSSESSNFAIEREIAYFELTSGTGSGDWLDLNYDSGLTYPMTAGTEDILNDVWDTANEATSAINIARVMNMSSNSPVYAHAVGSFIYMARRTAGSGSIDSIALSGFTTNPLIVTSADYTNNLTVVASARNESFPREVIVTLDIATPLDNSTTHLYGITATGITDFTEEMNTVYGGTRVVLPISDVLTAPAGDTDAPHILSAESLSDGLVRVIFDEPVEEITAETSTNYSISPTLVITSTVRDDTNNNIVLVYTELQGALTYTLIVNNVEDLSLNATSDETATFTGMAAVTVDNGPVGNTINGIGNVNNQAITAMVEYNNRLYIATFNSSSGAFITEVHASDLTGVYFTQANYPGFAPPTGYHKQRQTTSLAVFDGKLWASTSDTPSERVNVLYTTGGSTYPHDWEWDTEISGTNTDWGNTYTKLLNYGITIPRLYVIESSNLRYRTGEDSYSTAISGWDTGTPTEMTAFGGRMYVGSSSGAGIKVFRSKGANADAPEDFANDFEQVLDADLAGSIGMDGYDADDNVDDSHYDDQNNASVSSMAVFKGYIYIGTENTYGAQIWRSRDGLTWERVLDFGAGSEFGGLDDISNDRITSMAVGGNYLYAGTRNTAAGAEVWRSPDGVTWEIFGSNGFGSASYTDVNAMYPFNGLIYICMEDSTAGGAVFRGSF